MPAVVAPITLSGSPLSLASPRRRRWRRLSTPQFSLYVAIGKRISCRGREEAFIFFSRHIFSFFFFPRQINSCFLLSLATLSLDDISCHFAIFVSLSLCLSLRRYVIYLVASIYRDWQNGSYCVALVYPELLVTSWNNARSNYGMIRRDDMDSFFSIKQRPYRLLILL